MSIFKKLFGGAAAREQVEAAASELYKSYRITPTPQPEGAQFRLCARIEKEQDGETRTHLLIRADTIGGLEEAQAASLSKARQVIDEQGDGIFR